MSLMRKFAKTLRLLCCTSLLVQLASCGLLDFDVDSDFSKIAAEMSLNYDTVHVLVGDTVDLRPSFKPDTLNLRDVYVSTSDTDVVVVDMLTGRISAVGVGWAKLYVQSVSARLQDSCTVHVMETWVDKTAIYPYETVFYAEVTVNGKSLTEADMENIKVGAFVNDELRCLGEFLNIHGVGRMVFRVGGEDTFGNIYPSATQEDENVDEEDEDESIFGDKDVFDDDEEEEEEQENVFVPSDKPLPIVFRCHDRKRMKLYECAVKPVFDGGRQGEPSKPYKIVFK